MPSTRNLKRWGLVLATLSVVGVVAVAVAASLGGLLAAAIALGATVLVLAVLACIPAVMDAAEERRAAREAAVPAPRQPIEPG